MDTVAGTLLLTQSLDYETATSHDVKVTAYDGTTYTTGSVVITVGDINEPPAFVSSTYTYVPNKEINIKTFIVYCIVTSIK